MGLGRSLGLIDIFQKGDRRRIANGLGVAPFAEQMRDMIEALLGIFGTPRFPRRGLAERRELQACIFRCVWA